MQVSGLSIAWILAIGSFALMALAVAYTVMMVHSHQRIAQLQHAKLEELSRSEEKYRNLFDNSLAGILLLRTDTLTILDSNSAFLAMFRCKDQAEAELCVARFPQFVLDVIRQSLAQDRMIERFEFQSTRSDGEEIWMLLSARSANTDHVAQAVVIDITEKKQMEARFIQSQRMESIALLTGGLAHDLQNVLAPIDMSVHLLRKRTRSKSTLAIVNAVEESARNGLKLLRNILTYGRGTWGQRKEMSVRSILRETLRVARRQSTARIHVERRWGHQKRCVLADADQMRQVFLNLIVNAIDAMPHGGVLKVEASDTELAQHQLVSFPDVEAGSYVVVSVADSGMGIAPDEVGKIFEPFYTTKERKGGTGLGLSIAYGIVRSHHGFIAVTSALGKGTTFRVYLPAHSNNNVA